MSGQALLVGGTGFLGSHVAGRLAARGWRIVVPTRRRERAKHLLPLPTAEVIEANVHDESTLSRLCRGCDAVVNLVGILKGGNGDPYGPGFARAHVELPGKVGHAASSVGVDRLVHVSALQAAPDAPSGYLRSKAAGEAALRQAFPAATILRPSVIFGAGDSFLTMFAGLARYAPILPLASADALFQPVWVGNVADAIVEALVRQEAAGRTWNLCGPTVYPLRRLVEYAGATAGRRPRVIGLPPLLSWMQAFALEMVGGPMTLDNLRSMQVPSVCPEGCTLPFGLQAAALETIAPGYLAS